ncbi:MAG: hypothetical protein HOV79_04245 [Hamadaea sp.]|nr:hypothetical protein [Hamadaea sp.]
MVDLPPSCTPPPSIGAVISAEKLTHNESNAATGGIWLVRGTSADAVLKIARPPTDPPSGSPAWPTSDDPGHWNHWKREALVYTSGLSSAYADAGITAPDLLATEDLADGSVALWLAAASGTPGPDWTPGHFGAFALRLGRAQGGWIGRVPEQPWLSRRWLAAYLDRTPVWARWDIDWEHPIARVWPADVRSAVARLWADRDKALAVAETSTPTLAHLDVWIMNLFAGDTGHTLLDWAFTGTGGIGEDPANLIVDSVTDGYLPVALLPEIEAAVTDGYLAGLRDSGHAVSPDAVRRSIHAYGVAKYAWYAPAIVGRVIHEGSVGHPSYGVRGAGEEELERVTGLVTMVARWSADVLD